MNVFFDHCKRERKKNTKNKVNVEYIWNINLFKTNY